VQSSVKLYDLIVFFKTKFNNLGVTAKLLINTTHSVSLIFYSFKNSNSLQVILGTNSIMLYSAISLM